LGFEKSQRSVTHDFQRYINILTYLLTPPNGISTGSAVFAGCICSNRLHLCHACDAA